MSCFSNHFSNVIWSFFRAILRLMLVNYNNVIPNVRYLLVPIEILLFLNTWTSERFLWMYYLISINYISLELCYDVNGNETLKGLRRDAKSYSLGQTTAAVAQQLQSWGVTTKKIRLTTLEMFTSLFCTGQSWLIASILYMFLLEEEGQD